MNVSLLSSSPLSLSLPPFSSSYIYHYYYYYYYFSPPMISLTLPS